MPKNCVFYVCERAGKDISQNDKKQAKTRKKRAWE
jgi:hypothetical protein